MVSSVIQGQWSVLPCDFQVIGHRGYSSVYPENTFLALEEAFKRGISICEVDVQVTADDVYVLFHDFEAVHRVTNAQGRLQDFTYAQLQAMDVGSWKGEHFAGLTIPSLEDALRLAQEYDAQLYLDTKTLRFDLMLEALQNSGAESHRLMPSLNDPDDIASFIAQMPNSPWVWFNGGLFPEEVYDALFYEDLVSKSCIAFEVSSARVEDEDWSAFEQNVHKAGAKTWVFTENDNDLALLISSQNVDAIESDRPWEISQLLCSGEVRSFPDSLTKGNWRFENALDNVVGVGSQLRLANYRDNNSDLQPLFASCGQFSIAPLSEPSDSVMYVPKQDENGGLLVYTNSLPEDFGIEDQHYSIIMDVLFPASSLGNWISLFQTNTSNLNDAELFVSPQNKLGISEQYFGTILANTWYRIAVTVNITDGFMTLYLDGDLIGEIPIETNRWAVINSASSGEKQGFLLFADDNDETQDVFLSALQFRDYEMTSEAVANLGRVQSVGIPSGNADLWNVSLPDAEVQKSLIDYDKQTYHIWVEETGNDQQKLEFVPSKNATTTPESGTVLDWSGGRQTVGVISEDGIFSKNWQIVLHHEANDVAETENLLLAVYPNPNTDILLLSVNEKGNALVSVHSIEGVEVLHANINLADGNGVDVSQLAKGQYVVSVVMNGQRYYAPFAKM